MNLLALLLFSSVVGSEAVEVRSTPVTLDPTQPHRGRVGRLAFRGGLALSSEHAGFGGFSSVRLPDPDHLLAVSDEGRFLALRLVHERGMLVGVAEARLGPLLGPEGGALTGKNMQDAESLAVPDPGSLLVGFERQHRIWRYRMEQGEPRGPALPEDGPDLVGVPDNGGIETLVPFSDGSLLALTEYDVRDGAIRGFLRRKGRWATVGYPVDGAYRPSDGVPLPSGDVVVLERAYNPDRGIVGVRLRLIPRRRVVPEKLLQGEVIATLEPPLLLDNFEGVALRREGRETRLLLMTDDNFDHQTQRTLLLEFALLPR